MSELGYHAPYFGGIYGTGTEQSESDPVARAALQRAAFQQNQAIKEAAVAKGVYVAQGTGNGPQQPMWADQAGGPANLPKVGWTAQNGTGTPFVSQPGTWTAVDMGTVPDWTSDPNPAAAGSYDMTPAVSYGDFNPLNEAPLGSPFFDAPGAQEPDNPNTSSQFTQGSSGQNLEW